MKYRNLLRIIKAQVKASIEQIAQEWFILKMQPIFLVMVYLIFGLVIWSNVTRCLV
jgi:hypothetical protein